MISSDNSPGSAGRCAGAARSAARCGEATFESGAGEGVRRGDPMVGVDAMMDESKLARRDVATEDGVYIVLCVSLDDSVYGGGASAARCAC